MRVPHVVTPIDAHSSETSLSICASVLLSTLRMRTSHWMTAISWLPTQPISAMSFPMSTPCIVSWMDAE
jgi:hypothetical protein